MKILSIILILCLLSPVSYRNTGISVSEAFNVQISAEEIKIKSTFPSWSVVNTDSVKTGLNRGYYVIKPGISFEYKIIKY